MFQSLHEIWKKKIIVNRKTLKPVAYSTLQVLFTQAGIEHQPDKKKKITKKDLQKLIQSKYIIV